MAVERGPLALSIIIPVYQETDSLVSIQERFEKCIAGREPYEIIYVNDGNVNNQVYHAMEAMRGQKNVRVIHLSRNFGQHIAIAAGLKNSTGKYTLVMDADLQYLPEDAYRMYRWAVENKRSIVISVLKQRAHSFGKRMGSKLFYWLMNHLGAPQRSDIGSMFLVDRHVARGILRINDRYRLTIPMIYWLGGDIAYFEVSHQERNSGRTGYSFMRSVQLLLNGVTSFSAKPLYLSFVLSSLFALTTGGIVLHLLFKRIFLGEIFLSGWLSTLLVILLSATMILICLGVVGIYVGRIFETINRRPLYFVQDQNSETILFEDSES